MPEVEIIALLSRTYDTVLASCIYKKWKTFLKIIPEQGNLEIPYLGKSDKFKDDNIVSIRFGKNELPEILEVFGSAWDIDLEEKLILALAGARTNFHPAVIRAGDLIKKIQDEDIHHKLHKNRTDFRDWYTFTIDGSDAKDLDDAISIKKNEKGNYILAVHIADVAEYVTEWSPIDTEALMRATSIYTPGKVIPMLPEVLSNDLCSLHPGWAKLTLSCIMEIDAKWYVKNSEIVEGIIESRHRGIYDEIYKKMQDTAPKKRWFEWTWGGLGEEIVWVRWKTEIRWAERASFSDPNAFGTFCIKSTEELDKSIRLATDLYKILEKRRRKEGKITFESTEVYFTFNKEISTENTKTPLSIKKRERNDAHKLIEEFMVLANEEVAKWCEKENIPFLSRVHGLPGNEQTEIIQWILTKDIPLDFLKKKEKNTLEPTHIREFLEKITDEQELYKYSRLLLPKMAKATYSDIPFRHFGLALNYYSHFTSPIRRYPDLQVHRIIKDTLNKKLNSEKITHYKSILKKVARNCSEKERRAEDIERAMNSLYSCRYMQDKIGKIYSWKISGLSEFALFIEIEIWIEVTLYLPRGDYHINQIEWVLTSGKWKIIATIWDTLEVKIDSLNMSERRIVAVKI